MDPQDKIDDATLKPFGSGDPLMELAFRDFVYFAWDEPNLRAAFVADTGMSLPAPTSPLEAMIDKATGATELVAKAFIEWCIKTQWGEAASLATEEAKP